MSHHHKSDNFRGKQNHPSSYDESPAFWGPLKLTEREHRSRVRLHRHYHDCGIEPISCTIPLSNESHANNMPSTDTLLQKIVNHLASRQAPVDVKEAAESMEFFLRTRKRLLESHKITNKRVVVYDLCGGHGLSGMLFAACAPSQVVKTVVVDPVEPPSFSILRDFILEVCPWMNVVFETCQLEEFQVLPEEEKESTPICIISTHACGSLTDQVLQWGVQYEASAMAVMPCCYTGTSTGVPFGIRRALGVSWAADISRSFYLQQHGYHVDFCTIPSEITPMNRVLLGIGRQKMPKQSHCKPCEDTCITDLFSKG
eukprot:scaffold19457_cov49-Attheya_sp.AAC.9